MTSSKFNFIGSYDEFAASRKIFPSFLKKYFKVVPNPGTIALTSSVP